MKLISSQYKGISFIIIKSSVGFVNGISLNSHPDWFNETLNLQDLVPDKMNHSERL